MAIDQHGTNPADEDDRTWVAPGGWRRVVAGFAVGAVAGILLGLVLPRNDRVDNIG